MEKSNNYCIILAGGVGKRLWPCSRKEKPKQFIDFFGSGRTLLQHTFDRIASFIPIDNIFVSTYTDYAALVSEQLPALPQENILAEPVQLSTAPATAWASYHIASRNAEAKIFVSPCDQFIVDEKKFAEQISRGLDFVDTHNSLLAMAVKAQQPNTAYGYIQMGDEVDENLYTVKSFTEKPDKDFANLFVNSGEFLWNTGLFLWNAKTIKALLHRLMPSLEQDFQNMNDDLPLADELEIIRRVYPSTSHRSIDLIVLERGENVFVQVCDFGWADIGCWPELHAVERKDADGNAVVGGNKTMFSDSRNNLICIPKNMAAVIRGLDGFLVAANEDIIVVCPNNDPALVKKLLNEAQIRLGNEFT